MSTAALFSWREASSVKTCRLGVRHKNLVNLVNPLHHSLAEGRLKERVGQNLSRLINYTHTHFATEKRLMHIPDYPDCPAGKAAHERLIATVADLQHRFQRNETGQTLEVVEFRKDWMVRHLLGQHKRFGLLLKSKGVI
jgi:hemerythrin